MTYQSRLVPLGLIGTVAITRFCFRSHYLYDVDSVNFALAMHRFDPRVYQPHPPGYFLYVCAGRVLNTACHNANSALVILSIAASCAAVAIIYKLASVWFGGRSALFAGLLFLFSPLGWFHGTVALTYIVEAFFSALCGYFCWSMAGSRQLRWSVLAGIALGISGGVRPSSLLFLTPLFLFCLRNAGIKKALIGVTALVMTTLAWSIPAIVASGGAGSYFEPLVSLWLMVPSKGTVFNSSPANSLARAVTIAFIYVLCFGAASLLPLAARHGTEPVERRKKVFTLIWVVPALCFFTFGYLKFVNSGYLLLLLPPACIWLGRWASEWYWNPGWPRPMKQVVIVLCAAFDIATFLASPFYCSYRSIRKFEAELESVRAELRAVAPPDNTVIVGFDSHFLGYRHAAYYLPEYLTVAYPAAHLRIGPRIFVMHQRDTELLARLPSTACTRFVFFPLPAEGTGYREYLKRVVARLPAEDLKTIHRSGHDFVTGPIADLPLLFMDIESPSERGVYALRHPARTHVNSRSH